MLIDANSKTDPREFNFGNCTRCTNPCNGILIAFALMLMALLLQELTMHMHLVSSTPNLRHLQIQSVMVLGMAGSQPQEMIQFDKQLSSYFWRRHLDCMSSNVDGRVKHDLSELCRA